MARKARREFVEEILASSCAGAWKKARREWELTGYRTARAAGTRTGDPTVYKIENRLNGKAIADCSRYDLESLGNRGTDAMLRVFSALEKLFDLAEELGTERRVGLDRRILPPYLLRYMYLDGAFKPSRYNRGRPIRDLEFLENMLREENPTPKQQAKIDALIEREIYPYLRKKWVDTSLR